MSEPVQSSHTMLAAVVRAEELQTGKFEGGEGTSAGTRAGLVDQGEISTLSNLILKEQRLAAAAELERQREIQRRRRHTEQLTTFTPTAQGKLIAKSVSQPSLSARSSSSSLGGKSVSSWGGFRRSICSRAESSLAGGMRRAPPLAVQVATELTRVGVAKGMERSGSSRRSSASTEIMD